MAIHMSSVHRRPCTIRFSCGALNAPQFTSVGLSGLGFLLTFRRTATDLRACWFTPTLCGTETTDANVEYPADATRYE